MLKYCVTNCVKKCVKNCVTADRSDLSDNRFLTKLFTGHDGCLNSGVQLIPTLRARISDYEPHC